MAKIDSKLHEIFIEIKKDNKEKFEELYTEYSKLVYGIVFSIIKNKENSEDIVQKVFLKIWSLDKEKLPNSNESSWLYTLTKNETLNYIKSNKKEVPLDEIYYIDNEDENISKVLDNDSYNRIISKLEKEEQEIVSLKIISDLSFREIAEILNKPIGTIQWKYYKSLYTLKTLISNLAMFIATILLMKITRNKDKDKIQNVDINLDNKEETNKHPEDYIESQHAYEDIIGETESCMENRNSTNFSLINSISGIFLILSIVFGIIYIKQNKNRKSNSRKNNKKINKK